LYAGTNGGANANCRFSKMVDSKWSVVVPHDQCGGDQMTTHGAHYPTYRNNIWLNIDHSSLSMPQVSRFLDTKNGSRNQSWF